MTSKFLLTAFPVIILISLIVFFPSFNLALFGDDWYFFWRYAHFLGPSSSGEYNHLTYIITPYGSQEVLMGILRNFFGFNSTLYYITSYIFRMIAVLSLLLLTYYLTKNRLAAFFAALFFSITPVGLDTSNWVFNMTVYISLTFFNICLYSLLKFKETKKLQFLVLSASAFYSAHVAAPNRMTGLFIFIIIIELFWLIKNFTVKTFKQTALRLSIFLLIILFINTTGVFPNSKGSIFGGGINILINSLDKMQQLLSQGRTDFLFYPILTIGKILIPDTSTMLTSNLSSLLFFLFLFCSFLLLKSLHCLSTKRYITIAFLAFVSTIITTTIYQNNKATLSIISANLILIGSFTLLIALSLFIYFFKKSNLSTAIFIATLWTILSFIFPWFVSPDMVMPTSHRYLIVSAVGLSIILASIISLGKTSKKQLLLFCLILTLIPLHISQSQKYIENMLSYHNQEISSKIWSTVPYMPEAIDSKQPLVVYLENDGTNGAILHDSLGFGLDYRIALLYNINDPKRIPAIMDNWQNVISAVTDGKSFAPYFDRPLKPIPINNVYAFRLEGQDNLIDITNTTRTKLNIIKQ